MENVRIIYSTDAGGVAVIIPATSSGLSLDQIAAKDVPKGRPYAIVNVSDIPSDRTFRGAWTMQNNGVAHDMGKARDIAHDRRRAKRAEEFAPLDIDATIPAKAAVAEAKRQSIRDKYAVLQTQIDACNALEDLKKIMASLA